MGMKMVMVVINASILTGLDACKTPTRLCGGLRSYQTERYSACQRNNGHSRIAGPCCYGNFKMVITVLLIAVSQATVARLTELRKVLASTGNIKFIFCFFFYKKTKCTHTHTHTHTHTYTHINLPLPIILHFLSAT